MTANPAEPTEVTLCRFALAAMMEWRSLAVASGYRNEVLSANEMLADLSSFLTAAGITNPINIDDSLLLSLWSGTGVAVDTDAIREIVE